MAFNLNFLQIADLEKASSLKMNNQNGPNTVLIWKKGKRNKENKWVELKKLLENSAT